MALLREETRAQHQSLEQSVPWQEICSDEGRYVRFLARFYGFYSTWEPIADFQLHRDAREFMQFRRKTPLLANDLRWFGWDQGDLASLPDIAQERLQLNGQAETLGSCYVLEGSTLGGQLLSRGVERGLGLQGGRGYSYFRSYGNRVHDAWVEFGDFLSAQLADEFDASAAVAGAKTTFKVLEEWLTGQ
jgi:heme oxygenase